MGWKSGNGNRDGMDVVAVRQHLGIFCLVLCVDLCVRMICINFNFLFHFSAHHFSFIFSTTITHDGFFPKKKKTIPFVLFSSLHAVKKFRPIHYDLVCNTDFLIFNFIYFSLVYHVHNATIFPHS
jgi:hypothetical protein